jgi:ADP-heptose:LPS heptosyltransferase
MQTNPKILLNRLGAVGDVILTTPIVERLHSNYGGNCEISIRTFATDVFLNNPFITRAISPHEELDIGQFNIFINLDSAYERNPSIHILDAYELFTFGSTSSNRQTKLYSSIEDKFTVNEYIKEIKAEFIVLHMRNIHSEAIWQNSRNLPSEFWRSIINLILNNTNFSIIQIGSKDDLAFDYSNRLLDLRSKFNLQQLHHLISSCKCFLGVDSAPYHIAATTITPIVALFTTAKSDFRKPYRKSGDFFPISSEIDCYGCIEKLPLGSTSVSCFRGDVECRNRFNFEKVFASVMHAINVAELLKTSKS